MLNCDMKGPLGLLSASGSCRLSRTVAAPDELRRPCAWTKRMCFLRVEGILRGERGDASSAKMKLDGPEIKSGAGL